MKVLVTMTLLLLIMLMMLRIIKRIFIKFPAGASGSGDGLRRNGFISGIFWATDHHHHHHLLHVLLLLSICVVLFFIAFCFLLCCFLFFLFLFLMGIFHLTKAIGVGPFDPGTCFQVVYCKRKKLHHMHLILINTNCRWGWPIFLIECLLFYSHNKYRETAIFLSV